MTKPRLMDPSPTSFLKLADFGIAFEVLTHSVAGTPNYMPLEVWSGKLARDKYVDSYAAAAVLYEMVEGGLMVQDERRTPRPRPLLQRGTTWNHQGSFLRKLFEMLHDKPASMNSNWFVWKSLREAVNFMLVVDYSTGIIAPWLGFVFQLFLPTADEET